MPEVHTQRADEGKGKIVHRHPGPAWQGNLQKGGVLWDGHELINQTLVGNLTKSLALGGNMAGGIAEGYLRAQAMLPAKPKSQTQKSGGKWSLWIRMVDGELGVRPASEVVTSVELGQVLGRDHG